MTNSKDETRLKIDSHPFDTLVTAKEITEESEDFRDFDTDLDPEVQNDKIEILKLDSRRFDEGRTT